MFVNSRAAQDKFRINSELSCTVGRKRNPHIHGRQNKSDGNEANPDDGSRSDWIRELSEMKGTSNELISVYDA